jgi:outer membrane protein insertion porin family
LRGYQFFRVGKRKFSNQYYTSPDAQSQYPNPVDRYQEALRPVGGRQQALYQMEFEFPLIAEAGIKGVTFYDVGEAEDQLTSDNLYSDVGFGFRWFSPIGPLRFEWGFPLKMTTASPDAVEFQFSIGSPF